MSKHDTITITEQPRRYADCALDAIELRVDSPEEIAERKRCYASHIVDLIANKVVNKDYEITRQGDREVLKMRIDQAIVHTSDSVQFAGDRTMLITMSFMSRFPTKTLIIETLDERKTTLEKTLILGLCLVGIVPGCVYLIAADSGGCIERPRDYEFIIKRQ